MNRQLNILDAYSSTNSAKQTIGLPLRGYQQAFVKKIKRSYQQGNKRVLAQLPTGGGKSLIYAAIAREPFLEGKNILAVAHKIELITQLSGHTKKWLGYDCGIIANKSRYKRDYSKQIQVSSPQALNHLDLAELGHFDLIVVDECHHSHAFSYARIFEHFKDSRFLGLTATPARLDGRGLNTLYDAVQGFDDLIIGVPTSELIEQGHLCPFRLFGNPLLDTSKGKLKTTAGDFNKKDLAEFALQADISGDVIDNYRKFADGKRCVVFPASVELSKIYSDDFNNKGIPSAHLDAKTPLEEREQILEDFRQGKILVLCQHSIVIEGVDIPNIEAVLFARPTKSLIIWLQAIAVAV